MNNYAIYCTEDQTSKALELGAPIEILSNYTEYKGLPLIKCKDGNERPYIPPTAEQMILWLEEQELLEGITIGYAEGIKWFFDVNNLSEPFISTLNFESREESTLAAIDAALDYVMNQKKRI